jgi:uncharacterized protein (DUF1330 family)
MNANFKIALAVFAGAALGASAMQGLHAQAKLKAYSVAEVETLNAAGQESYLAGVRKDIEAAHGRSLRTIRGRVVSIEGAAPPQHLALVECLGHARESALSVLHPYRLDSDRAARATIRSACSASLHPGS